jgi:hypothetical protein
MILGNEVAEQETVGLYGQNETLHNASITFFERAGSTA